MLLLAMISTVLIFAGSLVLLVIAAVFYVPLLCYIQGNLKVHLSSSDCMRLLRGIQEYVCQKVDKVRPLPLEAIDLLTLYSESPS